MSRKHNTKHPARSVSRYPLRLKLRGLSETPVMESPESLRKRQEKRRKLTGAPYWTPRSEAIQKAAELIEGPNPEEALLRDIFQGGEDEQETQ